jgi:hypothetical protein
VSATPQPELEVHKMFCPEVYMCINADHSFTSTSGLNVSLMKKTRKTMATGYIDGGTGAVGAVSSKPGVAGPKSGV